MKFLVGLILIMYCLVMAGCAGTGVNRKSNGIETSSFKNEQDGFRGIKWGQNISELKKMQLISRDKKGFSTYSRNDDLLYLGKVKLDHVRYLFWHKKFFEVQMGATPDQLQMLKKVLNDKYGEGHNSYEPHSKVHDYSWTGTVANIQLSRTNFMADCVVKITFREISNQMGK